MTASTGRRARISAHGYTGKGEAPPFALDTRMACRTADPEWFFADGNAAHLAQAKQVCAGCVLLDVCRAWAVDQYALFGVWGGFSQYEREQIRRQRREAAA